MTPQQWTWVALTVVLYQVEPWFTALVQAAMPPRVVFAEPIAPASPTQLALYTLVCLAYNVLGAYNLWLGPTRPQLRPVWLTLALSFVINSAASSGPMAPLVLDTVVAPVVRVVHTSFAPRLAWATALLYYNTNPPAARAVYYLAWAGWCGAVAALLAAQHLTVLGLVLTLWWAHALVRRGVIEPVIQEVVPRPPRTHTIGSDDDEDPENDADASHSDSGGATNSPSRLVSVTTCKVADEEVHFEPDAPAPESQTD